MYIRQFTHFQLKSVLNFKKREKRNQVIYLDGEMCKLEIAR